MSEQFYDVDYKQRLEAAEILHKTFVEIIEQIKRKENPTLIFPKRTLSNTIYDEKRKLLLLGPETQKRKFLDVNEARKFMQTLLMAKIIYEALINNEYPTIRDLYYRGKHSIIYYDHKGRRREENTWDEQKESDAIIRDIEVLTGLLREDMLILSKEKGKLVGKIKLKSGGDVIDASKMGHGAYALEPTPDLIEILDVDADFVLVVEKDAVFQQLHRYRFWEKHRALLITSAGQPDRATRRFVKRLNEECGLPVYILTDADPYGWYIYSVFKIGSITLSYESEKLATPKARFLGVSMTDIFGERNSRGKIVKQPYLSSSERKNFIIKATPRDIKRAKELLNYKWFQTKQWKKEILMFINKKVKLEIEALASKSIKFLAEKYIPEKIENGWID